MTAAALPIPDTDPLVVYPVTTSTNGPFQIPFPLPTDWQGALRCSVGGVELPPGAFAFSPDTAVSGGYPSGEVLLVTAVANTTVTLWRDTPITRQADYGPGPLDLDAFNTELARVTMQVQDERLRSKHGELWTGGMSSVPISVAVTPAVQADNLAEFARLAEVVHIVENITALRTWIWTEPNAPQIIALRYNYTQGDRTGFETFELDAADVASADNHGTIIVTASGLRYKRRCPFVMAEFFGAKGDNATDDSTAFQRAHDANQGAIVLHRDRQYYLAANVTFSNRSSGIIGLGAPDTTLAFVDSGVRLADGVSIVIGQYSLYAFAMIFRGFSVSQTGGTAPFFKAQSFNGLVIEDICGNVRSFIRVGEDAIQITNVRAAESGNGRVQIETGSDALGATTNGFLFVNLATDCACTDNGTRVYGNKTVVRVGVGKYELVGTVFAGGPFVVDGMDNRVSYVANGLDLMRVREVKCQDAVTGRAIDMRSFAGGLNMLFTTFEGTFTSSTTRGLIFNRATNVYDRVDWVVGFSPRFRGFGKAMHQDNTRVVSWHVHAFHGDESYDRVVHLANDNPDFTGGGVELVEFAKSRGSTMYNAAGGIGFEVQTSAGANAMRFDVEWIDFGSSNGQLFKFSGAGRVEGRVEMRNGDCRPAVANTDAMSISGPAFLDIEFEGQFANNTRDIVRFEAGFTGTCKVDHVHVSNGQATGFVPTGYCIKTIAGATGKVYRPDYIIDTRASPLLVDDLGGVVQAYYAPGGTDVAVADGGTGASTDREACKNLKAWHVLAQSFVAASVTGTLTETTLATVNIPAGALGPNGRVIISSIWSATNNANNKTARHKFGGTTYFAQNITTQVAWRHENEIGNRNATNSQAGNQNNVFGSLGAALVTSAVDTTASVAVLFTGQLANVGDTLTLESYRVEILYGA